MKRVSGNKAFTWAGRLVVPVLTVALLVVCTSGSGESASGPTSPPPPRGPGGKPSILAFKAPTIEEWRFDFVEINQRRRVIVFLFDPSGKGVNWAAKAAQQLYTERHEHNLEVVGVMIPPKYWAVPPRGIRPELINYQQQVAVARGRMKDLGITFACVADVNGVISARYLQVAKIKDRQWLSSIFVFPQYARPAEGAVVRAVEARLSAQPDAYLYRTVLHQLGIQPPTGIDPLAGDHPKAPDVTLVDHNGVKHQLKDYRGRLVVFVFTMRKCKKCKAQMAFLNDLLKTYGPKARPGKVSMAILGVCIDGTGEALKSYVAERGYAFPIAGDSDWKIRSAFRFRGSVPDTFIIAPDGTVRYHHRTYSPDLHQVLHMEIQTLLGIKTRPMFTAGQYASDRSCTVCHAQEHTDWTLTRHSCAWDTLVRIGKEHDPKCIKCHVVGFGQAGGFVSGYTTPHLADVQCESCHGQNGCKAFTGKPAPPVTADVCTKCHDAKHSPRFDFKTARPEIVHNRAAELKKLSREQREEKLKKLCKGGGKPVFSPNTPYIGAPACGKCHPVAYKAFQTSKHAGATRSLRFATSVGYQIPPYKRGVIGLKKPECIRCHVTGFAQKGGYPAAVQDDPVAHPMAGVGCESCHGPGKAHADDPKKPRLIAKLSGTCNECNILPICRQCHDDKNSPRFNYAKALKAVKHPFGKAKMP